MSGRATGMPTGGRTADRASGDFERATRAACSALPVETVRRLVAGRTRVRIAVRGCSMSPTVRNRDHVVLGPLPRRPGPGDLLAVRSGDGLQIRRFVDRPSEDVVFTAGSERSRRGIPVAEAALVAAVEAVERDGRLVTCDPPGIARRFVSATRRVVRRWSG